MKVIELMEILSKLPERDEIYVEASPSQDYDRTTDIKVVKCHNKQYIITDIDSEIYKQKGL